MEQLQDIWHDLSFKWEYFDRLKWRTIQIALGIEATALGLGNIATGETAFTIMGLSLLGMITLLEKERVERRGRNPTGFQYLWAITRGRQVLGYEQTPFTKWISIVNNAAENYFPPYTKRVEKMPQGVCTWKEFLHVRAGDMTRHLGKDPDAWYRANHKTISI